jgi:hypothetical protein
MLKNPRNIPARKFALKADRKQDAIWCASSFDPSFGGMGVFDDCNANTHNFTELGGAYTNDTGLRAEAVFTGSRHFQVR